MSAVWPAVNSYVETYRSGSDIFRYIARLSDFAYYTFSLIYIYVICKILIRRFCSEQTRLANRKKSALARIASIETHPSLTFLTFLKCLSFFCYVAQFICTHPLGSINVTREPSPCHTIIKILLNCPCVLYGLEL